MRSATAWYVAPRAKHSPPPSRSHFIAQRRAVWDHTKCTSGRQPCPRAAVASRSFARSRRRRAERVRSGDDDVASGGGARIVHRRRGARAVLHVADAPVIELNARTQIRRPRPDAPPPAPLPHPNAELQAIQAQTILLPRSRVLLRLPEGTRAPHSTRPAPPARPTDSPFLVGSVVWPGPFVR